VVTFPSMSQILGHPEQCHESDNKVNFKGSSMKCAKLLSSAVTISLLSLVVGCHHQPTSDTNVAVVADYAVVVDTPLVKIDNGVTTISGTLHRVAGNNESITGRLDIDFVAPDGDVVDWLACGFTPRKLPTDPAATAFYEIRYGWVPPKDTTVRVKFVDSAAAEREDADNAGPSGSGGATESGHIGGGHGGAHSGGGNGYGSNFGARSW
jgi:hypothetical protein